MSFAAFLAGLFGTSETQQVIEYSEPEAHDAIASIYVDLLHERDLTLYRPRAEKAKHVSTYPTYNLILHRYSIHPGSSTKTPETMFSLYRAESEPVAKRMFYLFAQIFPDIVKASPTPLDRSVLESIVQMSNQNENYAGVHVAAALDMVEQLKSRVFHTKLIKLARNSLYTPMMVACIHAKLEAFRAILEVDPLWLLEHLKTHVDFEGNSAVHLAAACKDDVVGAKILKLIKQKYNAQPNGSESILQMFQKFNAEGLCPIHIACVSKNLAVIEELSTVADISKRKLTGSAASASAGTSATALPNLLDIKSSTGHTPLHLTYHLPEVLTHLMILGADPKIPDPEGLAPLHKTVLGRQLKTTFKLLIHEADPNILSQSGQAPLHLAAANLDLDCMKGLIVFGANRELPDGNGHTPTNIVESLVIQEGEEGGESLTALRDALAILSGNVVNLEENRRTIVDLHYRMATVDDVIKDVGKIFQAMSKIFTGKDF